MKRTEQHACFGGRQEVWQHESTCTGTTMNVAVYLPPLALAGEKCPVLYWLSGLTCNEQNFITKAGAQQYAAQRGIILVAPDTSPRGSDLQGHAVADDEAYNLGQGAGFYVNATQPPWAPHFRMYDYVVDELPALVEAHFPATQVRAISGHSMGGHGALTIALRNPDRYRSVSAFAPIVAPSQVPWGQKALRAYLGDDPAAWAQHDAVALVEAQGRERMGMSGSAGSDAATGSATGNDASTHDTDGIVSTAASAGMAPAGAGEEILSYGLSSFRPRRSPADMAAIEAGWNNPWEAGAGASAAAGEAPPSNLPILIDQGTDDPFLQEQLRPELLKAACAAVGQPLELRLQPGNDHSYYFIATFIGEHIGWHARILRAGRDDSGKV